MYLPKTYSPEVYAKLLEHRGRIEELQSSFSAWEKKRVLAAVGIRKVRIFNRVGSERGINAKCVEDIHIERAFRFLVREANSYLFKHRERFEQDLEDGVLIVGEQEEFAFNPGFRSAGFDPGCGRRRSEAQDYFRREAMRNRR